MKKILFTLAAAAMVLGAASCQKENLGKIETVKTVDNPLNTITVVCGADTRLAIDETLTPVFEENDVIFGWDKEGTTYAYTCTGVAEDVATFTRTSSGAPSANMGTVVNLVFAPGYDFEDIQDKTLDVNLATQGATLPVVMSGWGEVNGDGKCTVTFNNNVAIVDVKDAVLPGAAENEEYAIAFHGKNTSLKFSLSEGYITCNPAVEGPISSSIKAKASADSKVSTKFAVPASLEATDVKITATAADGSTYTFSAGNKNIVAGKYIKVSDKEFAPQYVAKISETQYTSMAKAIAAANEAEEDVTIQMIADASANGEDFKNANGKVITLDMNSFTITAAEKAFDILSDVDIVDNSVDKNGKISAGTYAFYATAAGITMNISDVAFEGAGQYGAARVSGNGSVFNISGNASFLNTMEEKTSEYAGLHIGLSSKDDTPTVNISGGTFNSASTFGVRNRYGICNVTGGVFTGKTAAFVNTNGGYNVVSISGGYFSNTDGDDLILEEGSALTGAISGGYFTKEISAAFVIGGYVCAETEPVVGPDGKTYKYTIKEGVPNIASVTIGGVTTDYSSIDDVISAVNDSESDVTVKLLNDFALGKTFGITNTKGAVTLDLNGKKISLNGAIADCISIGEGVNFTLEDSVGGGTIDQTTSGTEEGGYSSAIVSSGTFAMKGGTVTVSGGSASAAYNYTVNVKSGTMNMNGGTVNGKRTGIRIEQGIVTIKGKSSVITATTASSTTNTNGVGVWLQGSGAKLYVMADDEGNEPTIESNHNSAIIVGNATAYAEVNAGMIKNTSKGGDSNNGGLRMNGGETVINGGTFISTSSHALYLNSPKADLTINGGAFVAMTDGKYPLYSYDTKDKKIGHKTVITNNVSEPLFVGGGNSDTSDGRALYNGNSASKISVSAGYFTKPNLGLSSSPDTYVATGYKRSTGLDVKETIDGKEYTFVMQVVAE